MKQTNSFGLHIILSGFLLLAFFCACGQSITIVEEKLISSSIEFPLNEPHLVINPQDPNHLLIGAIATKSWEEGSEPDSYIVLYQSKDSGKSWNIKEFDDGIGLGADPWIGVNKRGVVVLTAISKIDNLNGVYLTAHVSKDAGNTWLKDYHNFGFAHDRQSMVVDSISNEFIIVSAKANRNSEEKNIWGLAVNRLSAGGSLIESTWHEISNIDKNNGTPIFSDGLLIVPYVDYMSNNQMLESKRSWIIKSDDKGKTFNAPILLSEKATLPKVAIGKSSILYYLKLKNGGSQAELNYSSDQGYTWESIGDLIAYEDPSTIVKPSEILVNKKGDIGIFWQEFNKNTNQYQLKCIFGKEEDLQFTEPINVASQISKSDPNVNGRVDKRWPTGGDYFGLACADEGNFHVVWVDHRNKLPQLYYAELEVKK